MHHLMYYQHWIVVLVLHISDIDYYLIVLDSLYEFTVSVSDCG